MENGHGKESKESSQEGREEESRKENRKESQEGLQVLQEVSRAKLRHNVLEQQSVLCEKGPQMRAFFFVSLGHHFHSPSL